ncbi:hypothetical protein JYP47_12960 [Microbacterium esteraromaticum]|nr:hypothetical protein [Microbacterium esteraromaticum]
MRRRARHRRQRRRMLKIAGITASAAIVITGALAVVGVLTATRSDAYCVDEPRTFPDAGVNGWQGEQLENAAIIIRTADEFGLERDGQILGVMAAMGESSLRNIDYGDWETSGVTNPDGTRTSSIGLFQQQDWWGSVEDRMDPATAARLFFTRLERVPQWQTLEPSHAIHRVQINSDRDHYARFEDDATRVVVALSAECPSP